MRVFIDASAHGSGGYVAHLRGILSTGVTHEQVDVVLACSSELSGRLGTLDRAVKLLVEPMLSGTVWQQHLWRQRELPRLLRTHCADILFCPGALLTRQHRAPVPRVTMSHNLHPFMVPEVHSYGLSSMRFKLLLLRALQSRSFRLADGVIFLSEFAKDAICGQVTVSRARVIPHGVDEQFFTEPRKERMTAQSGKVRLLYVSSVWLYKHQWQVLAAVEELRRSTGLDVQIEFVGESEPKAKRLLDAKMSQLGRPQYARYTPSIEHDKLPGAYQSADIFVFASTCETFAITLVEAMASSLPIACSNRRPMTDIAKDGAIYFEPEDPSSIADAIRQLIEDPKRRSECAQRAFCYAREYSWLRCARETFDFLRRVCAESRNQPRGTFYPARGPG